MAGFGGSYYPINPAEFVPTVDHAHERSHQHQPIWRYMAHRQPNQEQYPNQPDVDVRDVGGYYLVEVEVPGVKSAEALHLQWTDASTLVVSGNVARPEVGDVPKDEAAGKIGNVAEPHISIGERRIGAFKRRLTFPSNVDSQKLTATLEAGLLKLKIEKKQQHLVQGNGLVKVTSKD